MKEERLNPLNDYLFMKYMGEPGDEEQLLAFLNAVLHKTGRDGIVSVKIEKYKTFSADIIGDKSCVLDLRAETPDGTRVNIEVQLRNRGNMNRRSLFYWSKEYIRDFEEGQDYRELPAVIAINIIDFGIAKVNEVHACFHLWEDSLREVMLTDALEIHFISMLRFRQLNEIDIVGNPLHRWLAFFDKSTNIQILKKIIMMDTGIAKAQKKIQFVSRDKDAIRAYQIREKAMSDYTSGINDARREGISIGEHRGIVIGKHRGIVIGKQEGIVIGEQRGEKRGIAIGEQKTLARYVSKLSQKGMAIKEIAELTDLSPEEVDALLR